MGCEVAVPKFGAEKAPQASIKGGQVDLCMLTHWRFVLPVAHLHLQRRKPGGL